MAKPDHRANLTFAAITLFRRQGYAATGLQQILAESQVPRGSLYHYFPGGKEELGATAVRVAGRIVADTLRELAEDAVSFPDFLSKYLHMLADGLEESGYRDGCPIATTLLECAPESETIRLAGAQAFEEWLEIIAGVLAQAGDVNSQRRARGVLAATEGALMVARVQKSTSALRELPTVLR
jgi:TetR/AcrR family transcriptional repressor of lmrAB and yxaGH operons